MDTIDNLKAKLAEYEKRMGIGADDPARKAYLVLVKILRQQTEFLDGFSIKAKISSEEKSDATAYKNAKDLWEYLPKMISSVSTLRMELKMDGENIINTEGPISPQSIALSK